MMKRDEVIERLLPKIGEYFASSERMVGQTHRACKSAANLALEGKGVLYLHDHSWMHPRYVMTNVLKQHHIKFKVNSDRYITLENGGVIVFRRLDQMDGNQLEKCYGFGRGCIIVDDDSKKGGVGR